MKQSPGLCRSYLLAVALGLLSLLLAAVPPCRAEQLKLVTGVDVQTAYNDNVHFKNEEDVETRIQPSVEVSYGLENWTINAGALYSIYRFETLDELDHEDLALNLGGNYSPTERFNLSLQSSYEKNHAFASVLEESGDIGDFAMREVFSATASATWTIAEKDSLRLAVPVNFIEYGRITSPDAEIYGANLYYTHLLNDERTSLLAYADYTQRYYDTTTGDINQAVYTFMGGMGYQLTEVFSLEAMAGGGYTESVITRTGFPDLETDETFFSFDLSATCTWDRWELTLSGDREQSPNTSGDSNLRTRVRFKGTYRFTERFTGVLNLAAYENVTKAINSKTEKFSFYVQPGLRYMLTEDLAVRAQYKHLEIDNQTTHKVLQQNRFFLGFDYTYTDIF